MTCGIKRILQFDDVIELGPIQVFNMNNIDITVQCMYSWSNDLVCWTQWSNYNTYLNIVKNVEEGMYLRILLFDSLDRVSVNNLFTKCYHICLDQSNPFLQDFCGNENLFNPYLNVNCALLLQQQMSDNIICMFGIPIYYFRTEPDSSTADYTFKEYVLHKVVDVKQIKMMIQDGQMPSSNPKYTALDFDWQDDWETEIGKTSFANAFGDTAFPKTRDFIYVPLMKRMWEVNTAYDEKNEGFMWRSTTWKLSLIKYEDGTNIMTPDSIENIIDNWIVNKYEDVFGQKEELEQERLSGTAQFDSPHFAATNLTDITMEDSIRKQYSKDEISIIDYQYNHKSNVVARSMYKFKTPTAAITYQKGYCGPNGTLSFIIQTQGNPVDSHNIISMGPITMDMKWNGNKYDLIFNNETHTINPFTTYLVVIRWNKNTYTTSLDVYEYTHQEGVPLYLLRPEMYWFNEEPIISTVTSYNNDFDSVCKEPCYIQPYPHMMTNIKLYNIDLGPADSIKESIKYSTQHPSCVINDLARHFNSGHGYNVR